MDSPICACMDTQLLEGMDILACFRRLHICNQLKFPQKRPEPHSKQIKIRVAAEQQSTNKSRRQLSAVFLFYYC